MRMRHLSTLSAVACSVALAGCAGQAVKPAAPALVCEGGGAQGGLSDACAEALAGLAAIAAAEAAGMAAGEGWSLQGRAAISTGSQGGNARIEWSQPAFDDYRVTLSAPVTRQSWRLDVAPGQATITGLDGGPRTGPDAAALLREASGWDIPVASLRHWLRGLPAGGPVQRYLFDGEGRLVGLLQDGWRIDFRREGGSDLPTHINAERDASRVRLVIDQWADNARD